MKRKKASNRLRSRPKSRRPLYYVDNPNKLELKWLDDIKPTGDKPIAVHGSAPAKRRSFPASGYGGGSEYAPMLRQAEPTAEADAIVALIAEDEREEDAAIEALLGRQELRPEELPDSQGDPDDPADALLEAESFGDGFAVEPERPSSGPALARRVAVGQLRGKHSAPSDFERGESSFGAGAMAGFGLEDRFASGMKPAFESTGRRRSRNGAARDVRLADEAVEASRRRKESAASELVGVSLLFGSEPYGFGDGRGTIRRTVRFDAPFADLTYAIVAACDHPSCRCFVREKRTDEAVLEIVRAAPGPGQSGRIQWIAAGPKAVL